MRGNQYRLKLAFNASRRPEQGEVNDFNFAARLGDDATVAAFLERYPEAIDVMADNSLTALMVAAANNQISTVRLLLVRGANPYEMTAAARTARMFAGREGAREIAELLRRAEIAYRRKMTAGIVPQGEINDFNYAARTGDDASVAKFLDKYPYAVDFRADNGLTALMVAAANGKMSTVKLLLRRDARHTEVSNNGRTARQLADRAGHANVARLLTPRKKRPEAISRARVA